MIFQIFILGQDLNFIILKNIIPSLIQYLYILVLIIIFILQVLFVLIIQ